MRLPWFKGEITTQTPYNSFTFRTPGSLYNNYPNSEYPYYNEVLGVLNLLKTPKFIHKQGSVQTGTINGEPVYRMSDQYRLAETMEYVLNPAAGLQVQEIKAALIVDGKYTSGSFNKYEGVNATTGSDESRTDYFDIGCLRQKILSAIWNDPLGQGPAYPVRIKLMVNLKRINAGANTQNVLLVASYPVTIIETADMGTVVSCNSSLQLPESQTKVQGYCNSPAYLTSSRFSSTYEDDAADMLRSEMRQATQIMEQENISAIIYPNPVKDNITVAYSLSRISPVKYQSLLLKVNL